MASQTKEIAKWLRRIERSDLPVQAFFHSCQVPFSIWQYYRYRWKFALEGEGGLLDKRRSGNHRRIHAEAEGFLAGYLGMTQEVNLKTLQSVLGDRFDIDVSRSAISRCLKRLCLSLPPRERASKPNVLYTAYAGFELVIALALHLRWPQKTAEVIQRRLSRAKRRKEFAEGNRPKDVLGRSSKGRFTGRYNRRKDVRTKRFASVEVKRESKSLNAMDLLKVRPEALARKCLAVLSLPLVTHNGMTRTVNAASGMALKSICGFRYKQATLTKFLAELKYLGASEDLLQHHASFWQEHWPKFAQDSRGFPLLCYYVDGNTKALWSTKRVKKNKVTMLGRVMGCLEQVFIHDNNGRPVYFETYSGHAPMGEYVLRMFEKVEGALDVNGTPLRVNRAIVMDRAGNSVRTLRAFAAQNRYHYITSLDENQWKARKVRREGRPQRYRHGAATLRDCEIELKDSSEKDYLVTSRAIKINWDRGKETYLLTSLPVEIVGASTVVKSYFDRWPKEELTFKVMKAVASLHRVAGYGMQEMPDEKVVKRQEELAKKMGTYREAVTEAQATIDFLEGRIEKLIKHERQLRAKTKIKNGKRTVRPTDATRFKRIGKEISALEKKVKAIKKQDPLFRKLDKAEKEWLRLQGKERVYRVDVELDQIMTYFRISLVSLYVTLSKLMGGTSLSLVNLMTTVLFLPGKILETQTTKHIILEKNPSDLDTMVRLTAAVAKLNKLGIQTLHGKRISFEVQ